MMKSIITTLFFSFVLGLPFSQAQYTHADTLRGSVGQGRAWWDVLKYDLHVKFNLKDSSISGSMQFITGL
jgi:hypothetical protein